MKRLPGQAKKGEFKSYGSSLVPKCFVKYSQIFIAGVQANTHTHINTHIQLHTCARTHKYTYMHTHKHTLTNINAHIHTYT